MIDIGANIGAFAIFAASTSSQTRVYAYEPAAANFELLTKNIEMNGLEGGILPFNQGLAGRRETRTMYTSPLSVGHSLYDQGAMAGTERVECVTLKDVFDGNGITTCHLLKMDCEGAEYECLYNTPSEYLGKIESIRLEYHQRRDEPEGESRNVASLIAFLASKGFTVSRLRQEQEGRGMLWMDRR